MSEEDGDKLMCVFFTLHIVAMPGYFRKCSGNVRFVEYNANYFLRYY